MSKKSKGLIIAILIVILSCIGEMYASYRAVQGGVEKVPEENRPYLEDALVGTVCCDSEFTVGDTLYYVCYSYDDEWLQEIEVEEDCGRGYFLIANPVENPISITFGQPGFFPTSYFKKEFQRQDLTTYTEVYLRSQYPYNKTGGEFTDEDLAAAKTFLQDVVIIDSSTYYGTDSYMGNGGGIAVVLLWGAEIVGNSWIVIVLTIFLILSLVKKKK